MPENPAAVLPAHETAADGDPTMTGPRRLPLGHPEQLAGLRRVPQVEVLPDGALHPGDWELGPWVQDLDGRPTGAAATVAVDNLTAVTLHWAAREQIRSVVTTQLQVNVLRPLPAFDPEDPADRPRLRMRGVPLMHDALGGVARGRLVGDDGTVYVEATGWFQSVPDRSADGAETFVATAALPLEDEERASMAALTAVVPESVPVPRPGERPVVQQTAAPSLRFRPEPRLDNAGAMTHGGIQTMRAVLAAQAALPDRQDYEVQAVEVAFTRPGLGEQVALTRVRHAGRSLRIVEVDLVGLDVATGEPQVGRPSIQAQISFRAADRPRG
ncbi:hypothetical protein [Micrococcus sp.]|uniref:hypothetical protein n=1 Tax=Micrococcus sp. TaxID=1271 RepID=UPI002A91BF75|nr:hypothetical protein [Micrococcus sp.]MDY6056100.1 hypothetical protein [Micrococcus sp.]